MIRDDIAFLAQLIRDAEAQINFTMLEIGARPVGDRPEPFYRLLDHFPGSRILAFEVEEELCRSLNEQAPSGVTYYPVALGRRDEVRDFFVTADPMCSSLYRPNEALIGLFHHMEVAQLRSMQKIRTVGLDGFLEEQRVGPVDFIKIDIQGAELDVFRGGPKTLDDAALIVSEVEFVPHYVDQPLFGEVSGFLSDRGFMFHKFLGLCGRSLKPIVLGNDPNFANQHIWSDAVFVRDILHLGSLTPSQLLKLGILAYLYKSPDLTVMCFREYDQRQGSEIARGLMRLQTKKR